MSSHDTPPTCPHCGARVLEDADRCDLCGTLLHSDEDETAETEAETPDEPSEAASSASDRGIFCNQCGWQNPTDARFCSQCGARLDERLAAAPVSADLPRTPEPASTSPSEDTSSSDRSSASSEQHAGRQIGIIAGAAVMLVIALFLVTAVSKNTTGGNAPVENSTTVSPSSEQESAVEQQASTPLPPQLAAEADSLETLIGQLSGAAKLEKQRALVNLFVGAGRLDRAALAQQTIAEEVDTPEAWRQAGDLMYDWMASLQDRQKPEVARLVIDAYQRVLEQQPGNLDVRTDMATAYLNSNNPMQGVQEIKKVLDADPDHLQARFNYGIMLSMIGRTDQAIDQFERVKEIVGETSPYYQQANQAINALNGAADS